MSNNTVVIIYTTSTCIHCIASKKLLHSNGIDYHEINIDQNPLSFQEMQQKTNGKLSVPQIFLNGEYIGGNQELQEYFRLNSIHPPPLPQAIDNDDNYNQDDHHSYPIPNPITHLMEFTMYLRARYSHELFSSKLNHFFRNPLKKLDEQLDYCFQLNHLIKCITKNKDFQSSKISIVVQQMLDKKFLLYKYPNHHQKKKKNLIYFFLDQHPFILNRLYSLSINNDYHNNNENVINEKFDILIDGMENEKQLMKQLNNKMMELYQKFISPNGKHVDYYHMSYSSLFKEYLYLTLQFQHINLFHLLQCEQERKSFYLNLYNCLIFHAIVLYSLPSSLFGKLFFFSNMAYEVNGIIFTLNDIEHGLIRSNAPLQFFFFSFQQFHPKKNQHRIAYILNQLDARIHFALNCGAKSCPPIRFFQSHEIDIALTYATQTFLMDHNNFYIVNKKMKRNKIKRTIYLSQIFQFYKHDFDLSLYSINSFPSSLGLSSSLKLIQWIHYYLPIHHEYKQQLNDCLLSSSFSFSKKINFNIKYITYNWHSNAMEKMKE